MFVLMVTWIHVIAAMLWIGGMLFFSLVLAPCLKHGLTETLRADLMSRVGKRFRLVGWISIVVLIATGLLRLYQEGRPLYAYGVVFNTKLALVIVMVVMTLLHDFVLGPKSVVLSRLTGRTGIFQKRVRLMARFNLLIGLLIVYAAVSFVRGF